MPQNNFPKKRQRAAGKSAVNVLISSCRTKQRYASQDDANEALYDAMIMRPEAKLATYQCLECFGWHLTSRPRSGTIEK